MDSFAEPNKPAPGSAPAVADVRKQVLQLEQDHRSKGIQLSGRIIHLCHYLPVTCSLVPQSALKGSASLPSPPATPPRQPADIPASPVEAPIPLTQEDALPSQESVRALANERWKVSVRYGHSAMISGITSLSGTHEQLIVGWTGDVQSASPDKEHTEAEISDASVPTASANLPPKVPLSAIGEEERDGLEKVLKEYTVKGKEPGDKDTSYVPVWIEDKVAHGHYDGYCKQSESLFLRRWGFVLWVEASPHRVRNCGRRRSALRLVGF